MPAAETIALFMAAALALNLTPGPDMMYVTARSVADGRRAGLVAALGIGAGTLVHIAAQPRIRHGVAADPEQPIERNTGRRRRLDVEHVEHVDHGGELAARGRRGEHREQQARAARRARSDNLGQLTARKSAAEPGIQRWNAGRSAGVFRIGVGRRKRRGQRAIELSGSEQDFEVGAGKRHRDFRFMFANGETIPHPPASSKRDTEVRLRPVRAGT